MDITTPKDLNSSDTIYNYKKMETDILTKMWKAGKGTLVISVGKKVREFYGIEEGDWIKIRVIEVVKANEVREEESTQENHSQKKPTEKKARFDIK